MLYSNRIKRLMDLRGIKQQSMAKGAGVAQSTIHRILQGANIPNMETLTRISQALDVPLESLTHPNDLAAEIIYELHFLSNDELSAVLEHIRKERLWKARQQAIPTR